MVSNVLAATLRSRGKIVLCCASTGIAAQNFQGGMTAHSLFKLLTPFATTSLNSFISDFLWKKNSRRRGRWRE